MSFLFPFLHRQFFRSLPEPTLSYEGKVVIVTGSNIGLGYEACQWLVRLGASRVILAVRNLEKGQAAAKKIQVATGCLPEVLDVWQLNMSSYDSVKAFAYRVSVELPRLDALLANAGISAGTFKLAEGYEETITVNVISTFLLAFLVYPKLQETASEFQTQTHLTITASDVHELAKFPERKAPKGKIFTSFNDQSTFAPERYQTSKLLEIFMVDQMATLLPVKKNSVIINCVSPGLCRTELMRDYKNPIIGLLVRLLGRTTEAGSRTLVYGSSVGAQSHGKFVPDCIIEPGRGLCSSKEAAQIQSRVWEELKSILESIQPGVTMQR